MYSTFYTFTAPKIRSIFLATNRRDEANESKGRGENSKIEQLDEQPSTSSSFGSSEIPIQSGSGVDVYEHIAHLVAEKLAPTYQNFNLGPPAPIISANPDTKPEGSFEISHKKDDLNSSFDEKELLKCVPLTSRRLAKVLLEQFNLRANELTWMPDGTILIDETSVPKSNIFILFPLLFKSGKSTSFPPGYLEFIDKIAQMGLDHLIKRKISKAQKRSINSTDLSSESSVSQVSQAVEGSGSKKEKWWYLG